MTLTYEDTTSGLTEHSVGGTLVVAPQGEIDMAVVPGLTARLDVLTADPLPDLVLDLRAVTFVDCAGLGALCRARTRAVAACGRLRLVTDDESVLRVLRMTGLDWAFDISPALPWEMAARTG
ncbi:STAS domain-containing protein [Streptomyces sp. NPDC049813]|uniref:STAS domain-containing protein n=1 Tax=Streptomyces sp. NPDC049813 TaxID=3365597 RepID=UPI0037AE8990